MDSFAFLAVVWIGIMIPCWAGLLVLAFGATRLGIPVKSLSLNMGPGFPLGRLFGIPVRLGVIPGGNLDMDDERAAETSAARRIGLTTLIPIVHLAVGVAILGWDRGWSHFTEGFGQLVNGLLHPRTVGVGLLQAFDQVRLKSVTDAVGVLGAKQAAFPVADRGHLGDSVSASVVLLEQDSRRRARARAASIDRPAHLWHLGTPDLPLRLRLALNWSCRSSRSTRWDFVVLIRVGRF